MAVTKFSNRVQFTTTTTGTGTVTAAAAVTRFQLPSQAGLTTGDVVSYLIEDGNAWEVGQGTISVSGGTTMTRTLTQSTTGALLNLSGAAVVTLTPLAQDMPPPLRFPATQVNDADVNTLDDYEEGTWTPVVTGSTVAGTFTYTTQNGIYTKVGRLIVVHYHIVVSATSVAPTGTTFTLTGLPFAGVTTNAPGQPVSQMSGVTLTANYHVVTAILSASSSLRMMQQGSGQTSAFLPPSALAAAFTLSGTMSYYA